MVLSEELTSEVRFGVLGAVLRTIHTWLQGLSRPEEINDVDEDGTTVLMERPFVLARRAEAYRSLVELCGHRCQGHSSRGRFDNAVGNQQEPSPSARGEGRGLKNVKVFMPRHRATEHLRKLYYAR